jgi:hypothetical protein
VLDEKVDSNAEEEYEDGAAYTNAGALEVD